MKRWCTAILLLSFFVTLGQERTFTNALAPLFQSPDAATALFQKLSDQQQIPFAANDSVAFLYRGDANTVMWMGDFNGWGYDKSVRNQGYRIPGTNIWILKASFPPDARLDYKIVIDGDQWILDPENPHQQWSGVAGGSPNSELRMPLWKPDPVAQPMPAIFHGRIVKDVLMNSKRLGYQVSYSVYLPPDYQPQGRVFPVLYVTDGYEYLHEQMGNMQVILDNLIHLKKIKSMVVVFVDNRDPANRTHNRRMQELAMSDAYLGFFMDELIPAIESKYTISTDPAVRGILGTSMGGLSAAFFGFKHPEVFGLVGIQSPAFWFKTDIYTACDKPMAAPSRIYMTTGTIHDTEEGARKMKAILEKNGCQYQYAEVNQGHSWGNWRDQLDDMLSYFYPYQ